MKYYKIISLGRACDIAHQIRRHFGQTEAYPFDWLITPFQGLIKTIDSDFGGFLSIDQLIIKDNYVYGRDSDIIYYHDFEGVDASNLEKLLPEVREKYARRVDRWQKAISTGEPILFIRGYQNMSYGIIDESDAKSVYQSLLKTYPGVNAHILAQNTPEAKIEALRGEKIQIVNIAMPPSGWSGDDVAWSEVFERLQSWACCRLDPLRLWAFPCFEPRSAMLTDAQWAELEPLIKACRPKGKTPPHDLRCTISAILWRHQNGAAWRAIPADLGPWWHAAQIFIRWARAGVWERFFDLVQSRGVALGMVFLDGTSIRAHQRAAGAAKRGDLQPSETIVKLLADHVAALAPRLA